MMSVAYVTIKIRWRHARPSLPLKDAQHAAKAPPFRGDPERPSSQSAQVRFSSKPSSLGSATV